ncbi:MAG: LysM peptidoglycan-binding domain-containing protein [Anaerolineae bacterium]|nr:LysM peptidoglycan-binding domain-containing protein [Anaerolineae bacterium]
MNAKQWLAITAVIILNIIIFGTLFSHSTGVRIEPTPTWTLPSTFTPMPFPTATAIVMPTLPPPTPTPTPAGHVVVLGETLGSIAIAYGVTVEALAETNGLTPSAKLKPGDVLIIPAKP